MSSCAGDVKSAEDLLSDLTEDITELPDGNVYKKSAEGGDKSFLSPALCEALYGSSAQSDKLPLTEDFAIYLSSFAIPCEIAVFKCYSASDTDVIAGMLLSRISELKVLLAESEFLYLAESATLDIDGKFVIMKMIP